jgi:hypothetical protein
VPNSLHGESILDFGAVAVLVVEVVSPVVVTGIAEARATVAKFAALHAKITATSARAQVLAHELRHA